MREATKTDQKTPPNPVFVSRLAALIDASSKYTARSLSLAIGANPSYIAQLLSGKGGTPSAARLRLIAEKLETTTDFLDGTVDTSAPFESEVSFHEMAQGWRGPTGHGIRLLGTGFCDDLIVNDETGSDVEIERIQLEVDHVIRMIERPAALWNALDAFAIQMQGSSMERRYYQGDIGVVDPRRTPSPGQIGLFQLNDGVGRGVVTALVKELVRATSAYVELRQYNPEMTFRVPRQQVVAMQRIFRPDELLIL